MDYDWQLYATRFQDCCLNSLLSMKLRSVRRTKFAIICDHFFPKAIRSTDTLCYPKGVMLQFLWSITHQSPQMQMVSLLQYRFTVVYLYMRFSQFHFSHDIYSLINSQSTCFGCTFLFALFRFIWCPMLYYVHLWRIIRKLIVVSMSCKIALKNASMQPSDSYIWCI